MPSFRPLRSVRGRLVVAIMVVAVAVVAGSFIALHRVSGAQQREDIDSNLRTDLDEFEASSAATATSPEQLRRRAKAFIRSQGYHPDSRLFLVSVADGEVVSNQEGLVARELGEPEGGEAGEGEEAAQGAIGVLDAPRGLSTAGSGDDQVRVLSEPVEAGDARLGTFRVAESLESVDDAQSSLADTLVIVGLLALGILLAAVTWIATLVTRPLQRIAAFAAEVRTEHLDQRLEIESGPDEVLTLAGSFNTMLDRLQRAFEREREFVADASHELRTPVTIAHGELELLRRDLDPDQVERLDKVRRELGRMERLISEMLSLATAEGIEASLHPERIDLSDMLADLRRDLPLLGPRSYRVPDFGGTLRADPDRLAQVFRNLAANAVAHTDDTGIIEVGVEANGDCIRFSVGDDGPGVDSEETSRLFDRFYRTSGERRRDQGSGLGLAIARAIVEAHGGTIRARPSTLGGLEVVFELPGFAA